VVIRHHTDPENRGAGAYQLLTPYTHGVPHEDCEGPSAVTRANLLLPPGRKAPETRPHRESNRVPREMQCILHLGHGGLMWSMTLFEYPPPPRPPFSIPHSSCTNPATSTPFYPLLCPTGPSRAGCAWCCAPTPPCAIRSCGSCLAFRTRQGGLCLPPATCPPAAPRPSSPLTLWSPLQVCLLV
jgi:hypothetical protein